MRKLMSFILLLLCGLTLTGQSMEGWELKKDRKGIKVYTKRIINTKFDEYYAQTEMKGTVNSAIALLRDFDNYKKLFVDIKELEVLDVTENSHDLYYRFNTPFPAKGRESYIHAELEYNKSIKQFRINLSCFDGEVRNKKLIRIADCAGHWEVTDIGNGMIKVVSQFAASPGGKLPAFIVNRFTTKNPIQTLRNMKKQILLPKYQNRTFALTN